MVITLETDREQLMSRHIGDYDPDLQMVVEQPREADPTHLGFLRWLVERDRPDHPMAGPANLSAPAPTWCGLAKAAPPPAPARVSTAAGCSGRLRLRSGDDSGIREVVAWPTDGR